MTRMMVSTRGPKTHHFENGEKVLCYEPDPSKAKVLYDSKILGTCETKDKRGRKVIQYKVHFQGWSSSWDRKVSADFVLKDTEENRQLQRDLAVKAQLQLGAYLYRKERAGSNKKRFRKWITTNEESHEVNTALTTNKLRLRGCSEDNFSSSGILEKRDDFLMKDYCETDSCSSSVESIMPDEKRITLRISKRLRYYLEYDYDMVVRFGRQHLFPADISAIAILENFVKQTSLKMLFAIIQSDSPRRRNVIQRIDRKEKDFDKVISMADVLKEVADGLRIYLDFIALDYLLYKVEKKYFLEYLSNSKRNDFKNMIPETWPLDLSNVIKVDFNSNQGNAVGPKSDMLNAPMVIASSMVSSMVSTSSTSSTSSTMLPSLTSMLAIKTTQIQGDANSLRASSYNTLKVDEQICPIETDEQPLKRKLRSHRNDECNIKIENCLTSITNSSPVVSEYLESSLSPSNLNYLRSLQPVPPHIANFVQNLLTWHLLPPSTVTNCELLNAAPSMIFGATHLARLIVKLPDFLNASLISDDKLKIVIHHLDTFVSYLECHQVWFNESNYVDNPFCQMKPPFLHFGKPGYQIENELTLILNQTKVTRQRTQSSLLTIRNTHGSRNKVYNNRNV